MPVEADMEHAGSGHSLVRVCVAVALPPPLMLMLIELTTINSIRYWSVRTGLMRNVPAKKTNVDNIQCKLTLREPRDKRKHAYRGRRSLVTVQTLLPFNRR
ncbi:hypothetical protein J6590_096634 [Homalodisca vitripennis]|nr:hypothetical protein J6590_096634 [Homalodisca vitripennis]